MPKNRDGSRDLPLSRFLDAVICRVQSTGETTGRSLVYGSQAHLKRLAQARPHPLQTRVRVGPALEQPTLLRGATRSRPPLSSSGSRSAVMICSAVCRLLESESFWVASFSVPFGEDAFSESQLCNFLGP